MADLRLKLLRRYFDLERSTHEEIANSWLVTLADDLGTIRRLLIDLIRNDLIALSNKDKETAIHELETNLRSSTQGAPAAHHANLKSSKRLIQHVGDGGPLINYSIRLHTTVQGMRFLLEYQRLRNETRHRVGFILLGAAITWLGSYVNKMPVIKGIGMPNLTSFGLILDLIGVVLIFLFEVPPQNHGIMSEGFDEIKHERKVKRNRLLSRLGLVMIFVGFAFQLLASLF